MDAFLFWDAVIVAILCLTDFLLGKQKRHASREKAGEWWVRVDDASFAGLFAEHAGVVRGVFQRIFGRRWWGLRRVIPSFAISTALTLGGVSLGLSRAFAMLDVDLEGSVRSWVVLLIAGLFVGPNCFFGWLSLGMTHFPQVTPEISPPTRRSDVRRS